MQNVHHLLQASLSNHEDVRDEAAQELEKLRSTEGFATAVMQVFQMPGVGNDVHMAAALFIKNIARQYYDTINETDKVYLKKTLIATFLGQASAAVRKILQEAITLIYEHDFPSRWPGVLNDVVQLTRFATKSLEPLLLRIDYVLGKDRDMYELTEVIKNGVMPLTGPCLIAVQEWAVAALTDPSKQDDVVALEKLLRVFLACVNIFVELNLDHSLDTSPYFKDNLPRFMTTFLAVLQYSNAKLETHPTYPGTLNLVRAEVIDLLTRFLKVYDEEFEPFMQQAVWAMLEHNTTLAPKHDGLSIASMDFLAATAKSIHHQIFKEQRTLSAICTLVIRNISVRDSDLYKLEREPREYIAGDIEGSELGTRRHSACQLIQALCGNLRAVAAPIFKQHIEQLLAQYEKKGNWRAKSAAIYLATVLGCVDRTSGCSHGVQRCHARPPLLPLSLQADVIRFTISFRKQIPAAQHPNYIRVLAGWVLHPNKVVAACAASGIERMLNQDRDGGISKVETSMLFQNLFTCLSSAERENHCVMMCLMRVIRCAQENVGGYIKEVLQPLVAMLRIATKNPANSAYNHYMFKCLSALVKYNAPQVADIEEALFAPFAEILRDDVSEFLPYVFQIYAQMLELRSDIPACYAQLLPILVVPKLYTNEGVSATAVRFLNVFIEKDPQRIVAKHLNTVLDIAISLCRSNTTDHDGFALLGQLLVSIPEEHLNLLRWTSLLYLFFQRTETSNTEKYSKMLVILLGQLINRHGPDAVVNMCLWIHSDIWDVVFNKLWSPYVCKVDGDLNRKAVCVAFIRILTESEYMLARERAADWEKGRQLLLDMITNKEQTASSEGGVLPVDSRRPGKAWRKVRGGVHEPVLPSRMRSEDPGGPLRRRHFHRDVLQHPVPGAREVRA